MRSVDVRFLVVGACGLALHGGPMATRETPDRINLGWRLIIAILGAVLAAIGWYHYLAG